MFQAAHLLMTSKLTLASLLHRFTIHQRVPNCLMRHLQSLEVHQVLLCVFAPHAYGSRSVLICYVTLGIVLASKCIGHIGIRLLFIFLLINSSFQVLSFLSFTIPFGLVFFTSKLMFTCVSFLVLFSSGGKIFVSLILTLR